MASPGDIKINTSSPTLLIGIHGPSSNHKKGHHDCHDLNGKHKKDNRAGHDRKKKKKKDRDREKTPQDPDSSRKHGHEGGDISSTESNSSSSSKQEGKREMLKFMIHEVRELRKQIDPSITNLHRYPKNQSGEQAHCSSLENHYSKAEPVQGAYKGSRKGSPSHRATHHKRQLLTLPDTDAGSLPSCDRVELQMLTYPPRQARIPAHPETVSVAPRSTITLLSNTKPLSLANPDSSMEAYKHSSFSQQLQDNIEK